jgi:hypothetical protein
LLKILKPAEVFATKKKREHSVTNLLQDARQERFPGQQGFAGEQVFL